MDIATNTTMSDVDKIYQKFQDDKRPSVLAVMVNCKAASATDAEHIKQLITVDPPAIVAHKMAKMIVEPELCNIFIAGRSYKKEACKYSHNTPPAKLPFDKQTYNSNRPTGERKKECCRVSRLLNSIRLSTTSTKHPQHKVSSMYNSSDDEWSRGDLAYFTQHSEQNQQQQQRFNMLVSTSQPPTDLPTNVLTDLNTELPLDNPSVDDECDIFQLQHQSQH